MDLNITGPQDTADAEAADATLPDEARGHYTTAEEIDAWCDLCGTWLAECDCD